MQRMLFNATHAEETRVGIVDGQKLIDIDIETAGREARKSNIYKGLITRIEPSLEACFVDYGEERHGFLPFKEISRSYFKEGVDPRTTSIGEALYEGQELIVQVEKEERGNKGAALTTYISLAGRYLVLMPNNPRGGGVSRRVEGEERQELREAMDRLEVPHGMSTIARTAGIGRSSEELQWDLNYLLKLWTAISDAATPQYEWEHDVNGRRQTDIVKENIKNGQPLKRINPAPFLIVEESNLVVRAIRDYFQPEIREILVDTDEIYDQARQFMAHVMPDMINRVKRYREDIPIFTRFQIEHQLETAYSRTVPLPSGGAIVIDHTEALVAVDVNSARSTRGSDIEETAFRTNCEAADEVARQMRLRDLGGLIVIDFIDMLDPKNQRAVEQRLKDALRFDRARVQMGKISRFGLMELSRQRLRPSLSEGSHITCPRCNGVGVIRDTESCALQVLRILQEEALKAHTGAVVAQVPVDMATYLLNEKRNDITKLEARHRIQILLVPNPQLETPHFHIERIRQDDERFDSELSSYKRVEEIDSNEFNDPYSQTKEEKPARPRQVPVIKNVLPDPAPVHTPKETTDSKDEKAKGADAAKAGTSESAPKKSFWSRVVEFFFGSKEEKPAEPKKDDEEKPGNKKNPRHRRDNPKGRRNDRRNSRKPRSNEEAAEKPVEAKTEEKKPRLKKPMAVKPPMAEDKPVKANRRRRRQNDEDAPKNTTETPDVISGAEVVAPETKSAPQRAPKAEKFDKNDKAEKAADVTAAPEVETPNNEDDNGENRRRRPRRHRRSPKDGDNTNTTDVRNDNAASSAPADVAPVAEETTAEAPKAAVAPVETCETLERVETCPKAIEALKDEAPVAKPTLGREVTNSVSTAETNEAPLVQVETAADKAAIQAAYRAPEHTGREVKAQPQVETGALEQVETSEKAKALANVNIAPRMVAPMPAPKPRRKRDTINPTMRPLAQAVSGIVNDVLPVQLNAKPVEVKPQASTEKTDKNTRTKPEMKVTTGEDHFAALMESVARGVFTQAWAGWAYNNNRDLFMETLRAAHARLAMIRTPFSFDSALSDALVMVMASVIDNKPEPTNEPFEGYEGINLYSLYKAVLHDYAFQRKKALIASNFGNTDYKSLARLDRFECEAQLSAHKHGLEIMEDLNPEANRLITGAVDLDVLLYTKTKSLYNLVQKMKKKHKGKKAEWQLPQEPLTLPSFTEVANTPEGRGDLFVGLVLKHYLLKGQCLSFWPDEKMADVAEWSFLLWRAYRDQPMAFPFNERLFNAGIRAAMTMRPSVDYFNKRKGDEFYGSLEVFFTAAIVDFYAVTEGSKVQFTGQNTPEEQALVARFLEDETIEVRNDALAARLEALKDWDINAFDAWTSDDERRLYAFQYVLDVDTLKIDASALAKLRLPSTLPEGLQMSELEGIEAPKAEDEAGPDDFEELALDEAVVQPVEETLCVVETPVETVVTHTEMVVSPTMDDEVLTQVHTLPEYGTVTSYPVQIQPGREVVEKTHEEEQGLVQVETLPAFQGQGATVVPTHGTGREPRVSTAQEESALIQVETKHD